MRMRVLEVCTSRRTNIRVERNNSVVKMARTQAFRDNLELQQFVLPDVQPTGRKLGVGSYGSVEELLVKGLVCAGKRLHETLLERDNEGVINVERKYLEECQVTPPITNVAKNAFFLPSLTVLRALQILL